MLKSGYDSLLYAEKGYLARNDRDFCVSIIAPGARRYRWAKVSGIRQEVRKPIK